MKYIIQIAVVVIVMCGSAYGQDSTKVANGIKLIISTDKSDYLEGENVWLEKKLIIDKKIKLDHFPPDYLEFVTDSKNQKLNDHTPREICKFVLTNEYPKYPDTSYYFNQLLFGSKDSTEPRAMFFSPIYIPAEEYEITAFASVVIKGKIYKVESNPAKFTVNKPSGTDLLARIEYLELIPMIWTDKRDYKSIVDRVDSFITKYKNSVYVDRFLGLTEMTYNNYMKKSADEIIDYNYNIILEHPNFASNKYRLLVIMSLYNDKKELDGYLSMLNELETRLKDNEMFRKVLFYHNLDYQRKLKSGLFK